MFRRRVVFYTFDNDEAFETSCITTRFTALTFRTVSGMLDRGMRMTSGYATSGSISSENSSRKSRLRLLNSVEIEVWTGRSGADKGSTCSALVFRVLHHINTNSSTNPNVRTDNHATYPAFSMFMVFILPPELLVEADCVWGPIVGAWLGAKLGVALGAKLGAYVGCREGLRVGTKLGAYVGCREGLREGIRDGEIEGMSEGSDVGAPDGFDEGEEEGEIDGEAEAMVCVSCGIVDAYADACLACREVTCSSCMPIEAPICLFCYLNYRRG